MRMFLMRILEYSHENHCRQLDGTLVYVYLFVKQYLQFFSVFYNLVYLWCYCCNKVLRGCVLGYMMPMLKGTLLAYSTLNVGFESIGSRWTHLLAWCMLWKSCPGPTGNMSSV